MEISGGVLGWSECQFWNASPQYFYASLDGWMEKNGVKKNDLTPEIYQDFKQEYAAELSLTDDDLARIRASKP